MGHEIPVSVIVATYGRQEVVCNTITSILNQRWPKLEIIIVDQTPSNSAILHKLIDRHPNEIRYHKQLEPNLPKARNTGVRLARFDTLVFIDDDVVLPSYFIEKHVRRLTVRDHIGVVTGPAVSAPLDVSGEFPPYLLKAFDLDRSVLINGYSEASWFPGCNFSVKRAVLEQTGPFDESFTGTAYCEDVDMAVRVHEKGFTIMFDSEAWLVHLALASGGCETRNEQYAEQRARECFQHLLYCRLKHWRFHGVALTTKLVYRAYRGYLLNRSAMKQGFAFVRRVEATAVETGRALRRLQTVPVRQPGWSTRPV
jgi:GT2 family glycosyltransferase